MDKFKHVVGIIHTNYLSYTRADSLGQIKEPLVYYINQGMYLKSLLVRAKARVASSSPFVHKLLKFAVFCRSVPRLLPQNY